MREFRFRAWDTIEKRFVNPDEPQRQSVPTRKTRYGFALKSKFVLQQSTGLKDKNGKEIYEGDILKYGNTVSFVVWCLDGWRFNSYMEKGTLALYPYVEPFGDKLAEIVGNIFENPELLKP